MIQAGQLSGNLFSRWVGFKFHPICTLQHIARLSPYLIWVNRVRRPVIYLCSSHFQSPALSLIEGFNCLSNGVASSIRSSQPALSLIEGFNRCAPFKSFQANAGSRRSKVPSLTLVQSSRVQRSRPQPGSDFPQHAVQRGVRRMGRVCSARRGSWQKGTKVNKEYCPGNPVDSFCTPLYTSLHEIVDQ